jgi:hypothetical protein
LKECIKGEISMSLQFRRLSLMAVLLISTMALASGEAKKTVFKGAYDGREIDAVQGSSLLVNGVGSGTASHVGRFDYTWRVTVDLATGHSSGGVFQLISANGDTIDGTFVGLGVPTDTPNVAHIIEIVTITGGTGRFQGATGGFTLDRLVDQATGLTSGSLNGTLSSVGSTK